MGKILLLWLVDSGGRVLVVAALQPDAQNPRKIKDDEDLRDLVIDIKRRGVLVPLLVRRNGDVYPIIDGHRRHAAAVKAGLERVPCVVFDKGVTEAQIREAQLVTQLHSQALTPAEVYTGCKHWMVLHPHATARELAQAISRSEGYVSMVLSLDKCIQPVKEAAAAGLIGLKDWHAISQAGVDEQATLLAAKLGGASTGELQKLRRKPGASTVRMTRVKCQMGSGVCVTLAGEGEGLTLEEVISTLNELLKEAKKQTTKGWIPRRFLR